MNRELKLLNWIEHLPLIQNIILLFKICDIKNAVENWCFIPAHIL